VGEGWPGGISSAPRLGPIAFGRSPREPTREHATSRASTPSPSSHSEGARHAARHAVLNLIGGFDPHSRRTDEAQDDWAIDKPPSVMVTVIESFATHRSAAAVERPANIAGGARARRAAASDAIRHLRDKQRSASLR